jgi:hypothetical protein
MKKGYVKGLWKVMYMLIPAMFGFGMFYWYRSFHWLPFQAELFISLYATAISTYWFWK